MAQTFKTYVSDGMQTIYTFEFDYIQKGFIKVSVDGVATSFTLTGPYQVTLDTAPPAGTVLIIRRETPTDRLVTFVDGSVLVAKDLNLSALQATHIAAEALDKASGSLLIDDAGNYTAGFRKVSNLGDPTEPRDAVTKEWAETAMSSQLQQATTAKSQAESARDLANSAENSASSSATAAAQSAADAETAYTNLQTDLSAATNTAVAQATAGAEAAKAGADTAKAGADTAKAGADTAMAGAQTAQAGAQTAQAGAQTAQAGAQTAQAGAEAARDTALGHSNAASGSAADAAASAAAAATSASSIDPSSYLTTSGDQAKWGKLSLGKSDNNGHLTLLRNSGGTEVSRWSLTAHDPSNTLQISEGNGPGNGGTTAARFDPAGEAAGNAQTVITREKGDARYAASRGEIIVEDRKGATEGGQALTASTWVRRDLNTVVLNTISGASLAIDEVTLPAGTYDVQAFVPAFLVNSSVTRLYDVTNSAILLHGSGVNSHSSFHTSATSVIMGRFSLSGTAQVGIDHYAQSSATNGGGPVGIGAGNYSVFTRMQITKVA